MTRTTRRWLATGGIAAAALAYAAIVSNQALVDRLLRAWVPAPPDPVFPAPLSQMVAEHLLIVGISSALTLLVGLPLGIWVTRKSGRDFRDIVSTGVDFGQVFPPIAVLALTFSWLGLGLAPAVLALFLYGLLPVVSSAVAGIEGVSPAVVDAAHGVGMGNARVLYAVELPLSAAVLLGGVRTSVIINVGTATVAAAVGAGGLGLPIFTGISTQNLGYTIEGALAVSALALLLDGGLAVLGMWLEPAGLAEPVES